MDPLPRPVPAPRLASLGALLAFVAAAAAAAGGAEKPGDGGPLPSAVWMAPVLNPGGYSSEALSYAIALDAEYEAAADRLGSASGDFGIRQFAEQQQAEFVRSMPDEMKSVSRKLMQVGMSRQRWDVAICHSTPDVWHRDGAFGWGQVQPCPPKGARFTVGRTMYETDRLPEGWVPRISKMDEVWVPSKFALEQFASSGVDRSKLVVVPEAVDVDFFDPARHKPLDLGRGASDDGIYRFLSVFKWEKRKGWDVLLRAYLEEFSADDPVVLRIKTQAFHSDGDFQAKVDAFVKTLGSSVKTPLARYTLISQDLPLRDLPRLYKAADAFVLPSRGEGWGRPHVEAMSMGLPIIATNWGGSTEFLNEESALPLRIDGLEEVEEGNGPKGHQWAVPSVEHLRSLMRWAAEHREEAAAIGQRAREEMVTKFGPTAIAREHLLPHLRRIRKRLDGSQRHGEL